MLNKHIVFTHINHAELVELETQQPAANEVAVQTRFSTISCGTERANITGDPSLSPVSNGPTPAEFPRILGYSSSGIVTAVGENVKSVQVGDRVAMLWSQHKQINVLPEDNVIPIPEGVSFEAAAIAHIAVFPLAAVRKTGLELGESMLIMGLGILGQLAVRFAKLAGAVPVIAADPIPERREKALRYGADYALDPFAPDFAETVKRLTNGGVNTAVEVTGKGAGLNECLDCMARFGRVALLGCTRSSDFTVDYYRKVHGPGITLIGAHTAARPKFESAPHWFTAQDDMRTVLKLCAGGRLDLDEMVEETDSPADCTPVYDRLINDPHFPNVVQFDWRRLQ